jgi:hypothetical protein
VGAGNQRLSSTEISQLFAHESSFGRRGSARDCLLDDCDFFVGESVQVIDDLVNEFVDSRNFLIKSVGLCLPIEVALEVVTDLVEIGQSKMLFESLERRNRRPGVLSEIA